MAEDGDNDDDGGGLRLDTAAIKKMVKIGRSRALTFAFCPAAGDEEPLFTLHRRKKPDMLGKMARKESDSSKVAFGTMTVDGKCLVLTCERLLPGMEKKLKKMLREQKVPMDVRLLDAEGKELSA